MVLMMVSNTSSAYKIVELKLRGGKKGDKGKVTYARVHAKMVTSDRSGWSLKCSGKGDNSCAVPEEGETGNIIASGDEPDLVDNTMANVLIAKVNEFIHVDGRTVGSYTHKVQLPNGVNRIYALNWTKGAIVDGIQEYNITISRL